MSASARPLSSLTARSPGDLFALVQQGDINYEHEKIKDIPEAAPLLREMFKRDPTQRISARELKEKLDAILEPPRDQVVPEITNVPPRSPPEPAFVDSQQFARLVDCFAASIGVGDD